MSCEKSIISGIEKDCKNFNAPIGAEKDLILINYKDFDKLATKSPFNRQLTNDLGNKSGLTDIILVPDAVQYIFEGTDYSVIPSVTPEVREDGSLWYTHSIAFTIYNKSAETRATLQALGKSRVIAVTKDRSTGLYELFGLEVGLKVTGTERAYTGSQSSNFYTVTIATPDIAVIRENSLGELSLKLDGVSSGAPLPDEELTLEELLFLKEDKINKGAANGYAPLGSDIKVPASFLNIINDVTTGGATNLFSAEQGKIINDRIDLGLNNIKKEILISTPLVINRTNFADIINALPSFVITDFDIPFFVTTTTEAVDGYKIELIGVGKGTYGTGETSISSSQIRITAIGSVAVGSTPTLQAVTTVGSTTTVDTNIFLQATKNSKSSSIEIIPDVDTVSEVGINIVTDAKAVVTGKAISLNASTNGDIEMSVLGTGKVLVNAEEVATKPYVETKVTGLLDDRGSYNASSNVYPTSGGSGAGGAILRGDIWYLSTGGTLGGVLLPAGSSIRALIDTPAQIASNWNVFGNLISPHHVSHEFGGTDEIVGENLGVNIAPHPLNYSITGNTLGANLIGIDNRLGEIVQTTAGVSNRIWFTADTTTITAGTFYISNPSGKGTAVEAIQSVSNDDNQKQYFAQDLISVGFPSFVTYPSGIYGGQLSCRISTNIAQQRYTVEAYKCDNNGTPIASGVTGAPMGVLGVTVIAILDSGLVNIVAGNITGIPVSGVLGSAVSFNAGERVRYHVSAEKSGTAGSTITMEIFYGSNYNSYYDAPVVFDTTSIINASAVVGSTATAALNTLNTNKANISDVVLLNTDQSINDKKSFISVSNTTGAVSINTLSSLGFLSNGLGSHVGYNFTGQNNGVNTFTVNKAGNIAAVSYTGDAILTGNPTAPIPTVSNGIATKTYVDNLISGLLDDRGSYDASTNLFPTTGGSGVGGAILKGDIWYVSVAGTLGGKAVVIGDSFRALTDTPAQILANWAFLSSNTGYISENVANKATDFSVSNDIKYPTVSAVDKVDSKPLSFVDKELSKNTLSYKYLTRTAAETILVTYVYGDKAITYTMVKNVNNNYMWVSRIDYSGIDINGKADLTSPTFLGGDVQEFAIRYRKTGTLDNDLTFPWHGAGASTVTTLLSSSFDIDGIKYSNFSELTLNQSFIFDKFYLNQKIGSKYIVSDPTNQIEVNITTSFDSKQLHFNNDYFINENIDVNRAFGSRLSADGSTEIMLDNGLTILNDNSNLVTPYGYKVYSAKASTPVVYATFEIDNLVTNIAQNNSTSSPDNRFIMWNRPLGQTLYYNLTPYLADDVFTPVVAGTAFKSGTNVMYFPKTYATNSINISIPLSAGLTKSLQLANLERTTNKAISFSTINDTLYPSVQAVKTQLDTKMSLSGNEPFTGLKSSTNTGSTFINGIDLTNSGTSGSISLRSTVTSSGIGIRANITGSGFGYYADGSSSGFNYYSTIFGSGAGFTSNGSTASTGLLYKGQNNSVDTFTVTKAGVITGSSIVKSGGTSSQFLKADGSSDTTAYAPLSSPALIGTPTSPTATTGTNTTQVATTAFVQGEISATGRWSLTGSDIFNNNAGNVLIGTSTSFGAGYKFQVDGNVFSDSRIYAQTAHIAPSFRDFTEAYTLSNSGGIWAFNVKASAPVLNYSTGYTVATLPAGTIGDNAYVTDALAPTYMMTIVGGGAVVQPVFYNGTNWVAH